MILLQCATRIVYIGEDRHLNVYKIEDAVISKDESLKQAIVFVRDTLDEQILERNRMYEENRLKE